MSVNRRTALKAGAALAAAYVLPVWAQAKPTVRFAAVFSDKSSPWTGAMKADRISAFKGDKRLTADGHAMGWIELPRSATAR